ncbi:MAG TPA: amino acid adenylation domain-containing protein, partial [Thermoanaerobaculia bacterium]|nr:amino acid adenylation domain-containing protein [Thermoanaerobaculia bacterium]
MSVSRTDIEDIYGLSPLQQGLLFHLLESPGSGIYCEQLVCTLDGELDPAALERAWQRIVDRHPALRTAFVWQGVREPVQVVRRQVDFRLAQHDWRPLAGEEQERRLAAFLAENLACGFDLKRAPLLRCALVRVGEARHLLVWSFPHVLLDGWSLALLLGEVVTVYEALRRGEEPRLPPPRPFRDYISWLKQRDLVAAERYWRRALAGFSVPTRLGIAPPQPERGVMRSLAAALPAEPTAALGGLARRHQVTLNTMVQGAWALLLGRLSGEDDVVFGVTTSGRPPALQGAERMVGLFITTVPLRVYLPESEPVFAWLRRLQELQANLLENAHAPLHSIQRWSELPAGEPLFETLLVFENYPVPAWSDARPASLRFSRVEIEERSNYPLALAAIPGGRLGLRLFHDEARFDGAAAQRLLGHLEILLVALSAAGAETRLRDLPILSAAERHQLAVEWNDSRAGERSEPPLHRRFETWAAAQPAAAAALCGDEVLTYGDLDAGAARLARRLRRLGVGPEALVGIYLERSLRLPVAVLAVLKAGGAFLPLDPAYPADRLAFMLHDSRAPVVLTEERLAARLPAGGARRVLLDAAEEGESLSSNPADTRDAEMALDQLAYVIYTSGSTGRPKGVAVPHRGLANLAQALGGRLGLVRSGDRVLQFAALSFDAAVWEMAMALGSGATLVLAGAESLLPGPELLRLLASREVATVTLPPSTLALLPQAELPRLSNLVAAGEACPPELVDRWASGRRFWNAYGPTETTVCATASRCVAGGGKPSIGRPIDNADAHVVDRQFRLAPLGSAGELLLGGVNLARGYLGRSELTAERFVPDPWSELPGARLYRTGDLARRLPGGEIDFLGRVDHQVKVRGFRIEPGEIEAVLARHPGVLEAAVAARPEVSGCQRLVAYWVPAAEGGPAAEELRRFLAERLPGYMVPAAFVLVSALPRSPSGKIDRRALPDPGAGKSEGRRAAPRTGLERTIAEIWRDLLQVESVGNEDNFFDLGGHSLLLVQVQGRLAAAIGREVPVVDLLWHPTVASLARHLTAKAEVGTAPQRGSARAQRRREAAREPAAGVAIIGMAGRFPGARSAEELWRNVRSGVESISFWSAEELAASGVSSALLRNPQYVRAKGVIADAELFDARLFGFNPAEARLLDPQQRLFLECVWEALEDAGYDPDTCGRSTGIFAGAAMNTYLSNVVSNPELLRSVGSFQTVLANDKDFLPTRVSYKLNLRGPSVNVQTACSTSLVAVHLACRSLLGNECDLALAGGVSVSVPRQCGYLFQEGGILSPDGHCRAFDARAQGSVVGEGVGAVVLKRLTDAMADHDRISAVVLGSAINNDGASKVGFTAPSVEGQAEVIGEALEMAGIDPESIGYIETHGTGTALGDPVEVTALTEVLRARTARRGFCALGSVKTNIGHADAAAGVAGLIKVVRALEDGVLPPSLHFERPNPGIDFAASPFYVNTELRSWPANGVPRRAGVSAFGLGGTNAHVVLEQAPAPAPSGPSRPWQLVVLSAADGQALEAATDRLAAHLVEAPPGVLADVAFTSQVGRRQLRHRRFAVCRDGAGAAADLRDRTPGQVFDGVAPGGSRPVAFLFSGLGDQYPGMARQLYAAEPVFREELDRCCALLKPRLGCDLQQLVFATAEPPAAEPEPRGLDLRSFVGRGGEAEDAAVERLRQTGLAHPAILAVEIALVRLWRDWGIEPQAMLGYSLGEYTAAWLAGVLSLEDALTLIAERALLIDSLPPGAMLAVPLPEADLVSLLGPELDIAAVNAPRLCVAAGPEEAIARLQEELVSRGIVSRRLATDRAFHSRWMEPIAARFAAVARKVAFKPPQIPYLSNLTGTWITAAEATDPDYWVRHLCSTVRFIEGLDALLADLDHVLLEVGPGQALSTSARQHAAGSERVILATLPDARERQPDDAFLLRSLGRLWLAGVRVDWPAFSARETRCRVKLPAYPFQRQRYWIDPGKAEGRAAAGLTRKPDPVDWFYVPSWKRTPPPQPLPEGPMHADGACWLLFVNRGAMSSAVASRLAASGRRIVRVRPGAGFARTADWEYEIAPQRREDYLTLFADLAAAGRSPRRIAHLWTLMPDSDRNGMGDRFAEIQDLGFLSLLWLAQALAGQASLDPLRIDLVSNSLHEVVGGEVLSPERATVLGACLAIPRELPGVGCRSIDVVLPQAAAPPEEELVEQIAAELAADAGLETCLAYRGPYRWARTFEPVRWTGRSDPPRRLRDRGVYLITGGLGGIGLAVAGYLARAVRARLILLQRSPFPLREEWGKWLSGHNGEDAVSFRIHALEACEEAGAQVLVLSADIADAAQMARAVDAARARFGRIHGIVHTAGVPGGGLIPGKRRERVEEVFAPKVSGSRVLADLFAGEALDFLVLCSSLASVVGLPDRVEYSAASAFLDAFAQARSRRGEGFTVAIDWDSWYGTGMGLDPAAAAENGLTSEQGVEALLRILDHDLPQVAVSTLDLPALIARSEASSPEAALAELVRQRTPVQTHPRPQLATPYVAPRDRTEEVLARIWSGLLGIQDIGIHDSFLELGGDSILSLQVIGRARQEGLALSLAQVFERR